MAQIIPEMNFGIFNTFWDEHPHHLSFLNFSESAFDEKEWNLQISINKLSTILGSGSKEELEEGIDLLLLDLNWRCHLVAIVALLTSNIIDRKRFISSLWNLLNRGSWVSPQILVALSIIDKNFTNKAERLLADDFNIQFENVSAIEHLVFQGGGTVGSAKVKVIGAICFLLGKPFSEENDPGGGGAIAKGWLERLMVLSDSGRLQIQSF